MSGVTTPNPECLPDTVIPLRKSARIQSKRSLSHESTHNPSSLLNKPLEVGLPTASGFKLIILMNKNILIKPNITCKMAIDKYHI